MSENLVISEAMSQEKISEEAIREELSRIVDSPMFIQSVTVADQDGRGRRFEQIIGDSPALNTVLEQVGRVAPADSTRRQGELALNIVLVHGAFDGGASGTQITEGSHEISFAL